MKQIAICDNNIKICTEMKEIIFEYAIINNIKFGIEIFYSGENLIDYIKKKHSFDLIFLDIKLKGMTGIQVGEVIRNEFRDHKSKIIFISDTKCYEMEIFDVQPLNFLKKPIDKHKIFSCINLAIEIFYINNYFEYKSCGDINIAMYKDIIYFESC